MCFCQVAIKPLKMVRGAAQGLYEFNNSDVFILLRKRRQMVLLLVYLSLKHISVTTADLR